MRSEIRCHRCNQVSVKEDPFFDLSIPLRAGTASNSSFSNLMDSIGDSFAFKSGPLESYLQAFCATEVLDGKDRYKCEKCNALVPCNKKLFMSISPPILCLQLKRFKHDAYFGSKINTSVTFPLTGLDVNPYLFAPTKSGTVYDLLRSYPSQGIIFEYASLWSFSGGHYVAYCKKNEIWIEYDDANVRVVPESHVANSGIHPSVLQEERNRGIEIQAMDKNRG